MTETKTEHVQRARDNREGESKALVVSEGSFMTGNVRRYQGLGAESSE